MAKPILVFSPYTLLYCQVDQVKSIDQINYYITPVSTVDAVQYHQQSTVGCCLLFHSAH